MTRMGSAWLMRQIFFSAAVFLYKFLSNLLFLQQLRQQQQQWDCLSAAGKTSSPRPENLSLEPLVALLNGQVNLNVHCYRVEGN